MDQEKISEAIRAASVDNRITCERAHDIAKKMGVSLREIGALCNKLHIKIKDCQLGCF